MSGTDDSPGVSPRDALLRAQSARLAELELELDEARSRVARFEARRAGSRIFGNVPDGSGRVVAVVRRNGGRVVRIAHHRIRVLAPRIPRPVLRAGLTTKREIVRTRLWRGLRGGGPVPRGRIRRPHAAVRAVFDAEFYVATYGNPGPGTSPLAHYLSHGWWKGYDPSPLFSVSWYLARHPEVAAAGKEPLTHWVTEGAAAGDDPSPWFSPAWYLAQFPDLRGPVEALVHYATSGYVSGVTVSEVHQRALATGALSPIGSGPGAVTARLEGVFDGARVGMDVPVASLGDLAADLVTFDVWDTLVTRDRPADCAKTATARRMRLRLGSDAPSVWELYRLRVDVEAELAAAAVDEEYELREVLRVVLDRVDAGPDADGGFVDELFDAEVADEIAGTRLVPDVVDVLDRMLRRPDPPVVRLLSDFYIGAGPLGALLRHHGLDLDRAPLTVSCESGTSKRLGTAFTAVRDEAAVDGWHVHIGDNPHADVERAIDAGATAALIRHEAARFPGPGALEPQWFDEVVTDLLDELGEVAHAGRRAQDDDPSATAAFRSGVRWSLLPVALVQGAIETAAHLGVDRIYYSSREGAFLRDVHHQVGSVLAGRDAPHAQHLEISRVSTFGPSLRDFGDDEIARLSRQYTSMSPRTFLRSIGVTVEACRDDLARVGLTLDTPLDGLDDGRFVSFLRRPETTKRLQAELAAARALLLGYLDGVGFDGDRLVMSDVGWRGTLQDNLCWLRPDTIVHGVYLGLGPFKNPQPSNARKRAVAFDANRGDAFEHVHPPAAIETTWTPAVGSVIGYRRSGGGVEPVRSAAEQRPVELLDAFTAGVRLGAPIVARRLVSIGADSNLLRGGLQQAIRRYYLQPDPGVADLWFETDHDESFGTHGERLFRTDVPPPRDLLWSVARAADHPAAGPTNWAAGWAASRPVRTVDTLRALRSDRWA